MIFRALLTFYCLCFLCTGKHPGDPLSGITSTGARVREGYTAACPPELAGHFISIEGEGLRMCEDIGGAIKGNHVDLYVSTHEKALLKGVKRGVKVRVYPRGCV